jgi:integrase
VKAGIGREVEIDGKKKIDTRDERGRVADFHSFRVTFCVLLARKYPLDIVAKLMRHKTVNITYAIYLDHGLDHTAGANQWVLQPLIDLKPRENQGEGG